MKSRAILAAQTPVHVVTLASAALLALTGCAGLTYDRLRVGASQNECRRLLDPDIFHSCDIGYSGIQRNAAGQTDAVVVLLGRDNAVGGKLQATSAAAGIPLGPPAASGAALVYQLRGEVDLAALSLEGVGPLDALRAVLAELVDPQTVQSAGAARELTAAGLVRLIERWPHLNPAAQFPNLGEALQGVPGRGEARLGITPQGLFFFEYAGYEAR